MSKFFAIFLPIFAVLVSTLVIIYSQKNQTELSRSTRNILLGTGIALLILGMSAYIWFR